SSPSTSVGLIHSTCNCTSQNDSRVLISPVLGATSIASPTNFHRAAEPSRLCHCLRSFPSNKTNASEGGCPGSAVTTGGTGSQTSVSIACCQGSFSSGAAAHAVIEIKPKVKAKGVARNLLTRDFVWITFSGSGLLLWRS